jgi:LysM repeat protein
METPQQSSAARLAAVLALVVAFVVIVVLVASSLGGGGSGQSSAHRGGQGGATFGRSGRQTYVVKPGDTFSRIAHKVGISVERLQRLNPKIDQFTLQSGDRVKLR